MAKLIFSRRIFTLSAAAIIVLAFIFGYFYHRHHSPAVNHPASPITSLPQQKVSNNTKTNANTQNADINQGAALDKNGQGPSAPVVSSNHWSTSSSGQIVLKQPVKNSVFKSGDSIYGTAVNGPVQFRLIDNQVGVIAQGSINLVDGNFSAVANFKPYASSGRLDVFNTDANGKEVNEVQIPINF